MGGVSGGVAKTSLFWCFQKQSVSKKETGLRTKPSAEQLQTRAYDLYRTCCLRITGKHLASS